MKWFLSRLSEPSTWASIGTVIASVTGVLYHDMSAASAMSIAVPALLGVVIPEAKRNG